MSSVLPYSLETEALRRLPANVFGVLMSVEPAVAALAGWAVLGQSLRARDLLAIALVTAASVMVIRAAPPAAEA
jgi:inner membrane transporter RhtA